MVLGVIAAGLLLTWLAARQVIETGQRGAQRALEARANLITYALRDRLLTYEAVLHAGVGFFQASENVTADEWRTFVDQLQLAQSYPGLQGLGFTRRARLASPTATEGEDRDHTAIVLLEPLDARNRRAIGFDMMSEPTRRRAMERARDSGGVVLSGAVVLVQEITREKQAGFLMYAPLYASKAPPLTLEERRRSLIGFIYCPFRAQDFLNTVVEDLPSDVKLELIDAQAERSPRLLFRNVVAPYPPHVPIVERTMEVLGHKWSLRVIPQPEFYETVRATPASWVWTAGAATTAVLAILVWSLARSREHLSARLVAEQRSGQRERYSFSVLENSLDAYIAIDADDRIVEWNRQAVSIFGWSEDEARGMRLIDTIVPERLRGEHLAALHSFGSRPPAIVGRRVEMPACKRDGAEITVELSIVATSRDNQPVFVASLRDVTELRRQQRQIATLNATLEQRVQERTRELAIANRELHVANTQLEAFAQNVSHDLRAPLRAIEGYTRIVADEQAAKLSVEARSHLESVSRNARKMQRLIDDMMKLAFLGRQQVDKRMINLWTLVLGVLGDLPKREETVIQAKPDELAEVFADPNLLEHALRNLLANAIKFTSRAARPTIAIGSEIRHGERVFYIRDNGVGFDPQRASKLFEVFHRLHGDKEFEGTGVGLTIVKSVIDRHGGRIWVESAVGKGATFYFTLGERESSPDAAAAANEF